MIRTQVQLTEEQFQALKDIAAVRSVSVAQLVREGVDVLIGAAPNTSATERRRRAIAAAGRFSSDRTDVSARHDYYLTEAYQQGFQCLPS